MGGFGRFLLGGVLGAVLGFLISRRQSQTRRTGVQPLPPRDERPAGAPSGESVPAAAAIRPEPEVVPLWASENAMAPEAAEFETALAVDPVEFERADIPEPAVEVTPEVQEVDAVAEAVSNFVHRGPEISEPKTAEFEEGFEEVVLPVSDSAPGPREPVAAGRPSESAIADDLRARIEETRRRIRRELEEPFVLGANQMAAEEVIGPRSVEPQIEEALMDRLHVSDEMRIDEMRTDEQPADEWSFGFRSTEEQSPEQVLAEERIPGPMSAEELSPEQEPAEERSAEQVSAEEWSQDAEEQAAPLVPASIPSAGASSTGESEVWESGEEPFSKRNREYDAMRTRIEMTRSRLKAKAFDAMMSGESALLGRDSEHSLLPEAPVDIDTDILATIEASLREDED